MEVRLCHFLAQTFQWFLAYLQYKPKSFSSPTGLMNYSPSLRSCLPSLSAVTSPGKAHPQLRALQLVLPYPEHPEHHHLPRCDFLLCSFQESAWIAPRWGEHFSPPYLRWSLPNHLTPPPLGPCFVFSWCYYICVYIVYTHCIITCYCLPLPLGYKPPKDSNFVLITAVPQNLKSSWYIIAAQLIFVEWLTDLFFHPCGTFTSQQLLTLFIKYLRVLRSFYI